MYALTLAGQALAKEFEARMREMFYGFHWKALLAAPVAFVAERLCGDWRVIAVWLAFLALDFVSGVYKALAFNVFRLAAVYGWLKKLLVHLACLAALNLLLWSLSLTSGEPNMLLNWVVMLLTVCEAASAASNFAEAGVRFPPVVLWLLKRVRTKSLTALGSALGDEDVADYLAMEKELRRRRAGDRRQGRLPDSGKRRRKSDDDEI
jgi:phage-related holin